MSLPAQQDRDKSLATFATGKEGRVSPTIFDYFQVMRKVVNLELKFIQDANMISE